MPKSLSRIVALFVMFSLVLSDMEGLAQAAAPPRFMQNDFSSEHFCREAVPAPLEWMQRSQGLGYALRRMAAATVSVLLVGSTAPAVLSAGRAPADVKGPILPGRPPFKTFEEALKMVRESGGRDVQTPEQIERAEGLFGNLKIWLEGPDGSYTLQALRMRPGNANVLAFYENFLIQFQLETKSYSVRYRLGNEPIELLNDARARVLMHEQSRMVYVVLPGTPDAPGGLYRISETFKGDDSNFGVLQLAIIRGSAPVASNTLKSLLLPILLLIAPTLYASGFDSSRVDPYRSLREFWNMLISGEILVHAQPHVAVDPIWGWGSVTFILLAAAALAARRIQPSFKRQALAFEPWTFSRVVRMVMVVALFVMLSGTTLIAYGPNDVFDPPAARGSFIFLAAA